MKYNAEAGEQQMVLSADGIVAERPGIKSEIKWDMVQTIWSIEGATLIDLHTARLSVPHAALPENTTPNDFEMQLHEWKSAT